MNGDSERNTVGVNCEVDSFDIIFCHQLNAFRTKNITHTKYADDSKREQ